MWQTSNRIAGYYSRDARCRVQLANRDLRFIAAMMKLGFEYTREADRMAAAAAHEWAVAMAQLRK